MTLVVRLPLPDRGLSPNARLHYMAKHRLVKAARELAGWETKASNPQRWTPPEHGLIKLALTWRLPDNRPRDDDNLVSSLKSFRDGIADALGCDDSRFDIVKLTRTIDRANPGVTIEITA